MSTDQLNRPSHRAARRPDPWLGRAWTAVATTPLFFAIAFAVGEGVYALLGYKPENADAPGWAVAVAAIVVLAVAVLPCAAAVLFGRRAVAGEDRRGRVPLALGVLIGVGLVVLTIVTEVGDALR